MRPIFITSLTLMAGAWAIINDPIFQGMAVSLLFGAGVATIMAVIVIPLGCISARKQFYLEETESGEIELSGRYSEVEETAGAKPRAAGGTPLWMRVWGLTFSILSWTFQILRAIVIILWQLILGLYRKFRPAPRRLPPRGGPAPGSPPPGGGAPGAPPAPKGSTAGSAAPGEGASGQPAGQTATSNAVSEKAEKASPKRASTEPAAATRPNATAPAAAPMGNGDAEQPRPAQAVAREPASKASPKSVATAASAKTARRRTPSRPAAAAVEAVSAPASPTPLKVRSGRRQADTAPARGAGQGTEGTSQRVAPANSKTARSASRFGQRRPGADSAGSGDNRARSAGSVPNDSASPGDAAADAYEDFSRLAGAAGKSADTGEDPPPASPPSRGSNKETQNGRGKRRGIRLKGSDL
jgi:hypothetical protein